MSAIPKLRFPEFSGEWEVKKLGDLISSLDAGVSVNSEDRPAKSNEKAILKTSCVTVGVFDCNENKVVTSGFEIKRLKEFVAKDTIIISRMNTPQLVGANAFVEEDHPNIYLPDRLWAAKIKKNAHPKWVALVVGSKKFRTKLSMLATGTSNSMKNITKRDVLIIGVATPDFTEQQIIAGFLTVVEKQIAAIDKKVGLLKRYKKGVVQRIFIQQLRFKDEDGESYPDWEARKIGDVFIEVTDKVGQETVNTYSITAGKGFVSQKSKFGRDISGQQNSNYILLQPGEFSYNKGNSKTYSYGCVYSNHESIQIAVPSVFISFRLKSKAMVGDYFEQLFLDHYLDRYLRQIISSGARMDGLLNVSKDDFFDIIIPVPCNEEQKKIADFLAIIDTKIKIEENRLIAANTFKKTLLQRMFV